MGKRYSIVYFEADLYGIGQPHVANCAYFSSSKVQAYLDAGFSHLPQTDDLNEDVATALEATKGASQTCNNCVVGLACRFFSQASAGVVDDTFTAACSSEVPVNTHMGPMQMIGVAFTIKCVVHICMFEASWLPDMDIYL